ncbi:HD domain-containing protein [Humisphaera borealis]|uniref:HD domain-containing protein n=1 Tax=Humisphaera borealis TaxID=2807512 RepID=A0A7M2WU24_9BACT|nr:HD domain-containing protein [Humisphaera borealis]QOV88301.1 HD domain-containing protein [Humisphaera borealis]
MPSTFLTPGTRSTARSVDGWRIGPFGLDVANRDLSCAVHVSLERWVKRTLGSIDHEQRVADIATDLFDVVGDLHQLDAADLRLLRWASIVHDVGRAVCDDTHPEQGAKLLRSERSLPLLPAERRHLVYLTLYHRGKVPSPGRDDVLSAGDDHERLYRTLALLRAADGLDNRDLGGKFHAPPRVVFGLTRRSALRANTLHVTCYLDQDSAKARRVYSRRKKFRLLEEVLSCQIAPTVIVAGSGKSVA